MISTFPTVVLFVFLFVFIHADDTSYEHHETLSLHNECKKYADHAREQYNARKRAAYRIKRNEDIVSLQNENQPVVAKSGKLDGHS
jgi:hypothetical protein